MNSKYEIIIYWSEEDDAYLAEVPELPGCVADGGTSAQRVEALQREALGLGGRALGLADVSFSFEALPLLPVAALLWFGDTEFAGEARVLFDAGAHHCLPTEDLAGVGDWLAHRLARE